MKATSIAVLLLATALAACGGDDEPPRPSKAQYVRQANAICAAANERVEPLLREHLMKRPPTARDVAAFAQAVVPIERETLAKLRNLPAPAGDAATVARIYDAATRATDTLERAASDPRLAMRILDADPFARSERLANQYGLTACGATDE